MKRSRNESLACSGEKPKESAVGGSSANGGIMDYPSQIEPPEQFATELPSSSGGTSTTDTSVRRRNKFQRSVSIGGSKVTPTPSTSCKEHQHAISASAAKTRTRNSSYEDYYQSAASGASGGGGGSAGSSAGCGVVGGGSGANSEFLSHTSPAWKKLFEHGPISSKLFESPVISFLMRWNDLDALQVLLCFF